MSASSHNHNPTACTTSATQAFALSPRSKFDPSDMDPITVIHTQAMDGHGQDTTLRESPDWSAGKEFCRSYQFAWIPTAQFG